MRALRLAAWWLVMHVLAPIAWALLVASVRLLPHFRGRLSKWLAMASGWLSRLGSRALDVIDPRGGRS